MSRMSQVAKIRSQVTRENPSRELARDSQRHSRVLHEAAGQYFGDSVLLQAIIPSFAHLMTNI